MKKVFSDKGKLPFEKKIVKHSVLKSSLSNGINTFKEHFVLKNSESIADWNQIYKVYDRKCDHANGKLICFDGKISCPLHGWTFDPSTSQYNNINTKKKSD